MAAEALEHRRPRLQDGGVARADQGLTCRRLTLGAAFLLAAIVTAIVTGGCRKTTGVVPTERLQVTKVALGPALVAPDHLASAQRHLTWGEAYEARARQPDFHWKGLFEGQLEERTGLVELVRGPDDASRFAFEADLLEADVPTRPWLCARMTLGSLPPDACARRLYRTVAADRILLAFIPSWDTTSRVAELFDGTMHETTIPALSELRIVSIDNRTVALAWSHWIRSPQWTGASVVVLHVSPPLERAGEISVAETDARDPAKVAYWLGTLKIADDGLRITGRRSVRDRESNDEISGTDVDDRWALGADGKLVKR
jgi:hypothetical protein